MTSHAVDEVVVLKPQGGLCEGNECDEMERVLIGLMEQGRRAIVDLSATRLLTARGLGILARAQRVAAQHGARIALCGAVGLERWLLGVTHLAEAMPVLGTEQEALRYLQAVRVVA